ncbi:hypothetical protein [Lentzea jiangxiensis]|uniref:hypothetical protein n=1 Tax=Lentzea jiangxiensis TaxID=641025 RepID=UPI00115F84F0|nr:hypothetical protein [Lentzea jiangxiensis]
MENLLEPQDVPGRWTRAHIRVTFAVRRPLVAPVRRDGVARRPGTAAAARRRPQIDSEALPPHRADLISRALEGVISADLPQGGQEMDEEREHARDLLLKLTERTGPLV